MWSSEIKGHIIGEEIRDDCTLRPACAQERLCARSQAEGGPKFRGLEEGEKLHQSLVTKHCVLVGHWGQAVELIIYEAKNGNLRVHVYPYR